MQNAPVVVFAYKRPRHLEQALRGLAANDLAADSPLIIFCDGPKPSATEADKQAIGEVRRIAHAATGFASLEVVEAQANKGLARSVIDGVTRVVKEHGRVIVVEDDAAVSPYFLRFMNEALTIYEQDRRVGSIGSWPYFMPDGRHSRDFFLNHPDSIAWATWERAWALFEPDGRKLMGQLKNRGCAAVLDGGISPPYYTEMLKDQIRGRVDSWAIRWTATSILHGMLTLFPKAALSKHMGFGLGATHETGVEDYNRDLSLATVPITCDGESPVLSLEAQARWAEFVQVTFAPPANSLKDHVWRALPNRLKQWYLRRKNAGGPGPAALARPPVSRVFGFDRGMPVDRHYIERFLRMHRELIAGQVLEVADSTYTRRFAPGAVEPWVLLFRGEARPGTLIGDLADPASLPSGTMDAFVCTQTLNFIYDMHAAVRGIHQVLKPGGTALVTVAALSQISRYDADRWGDFWRFTPDSARRMFCDVFGAGNVHIEAYGNSYAAACLMKGFATEECDAALLDQADPDYPVLIGIKARRIA